MRYAGALHVVPVDMREGGPCVSRGDSMKEERNEIAEAALRRFAVDREGSTHLADRTAAECGTLSMHVRANEALLLV
ncbi:hypothetical protein QZM79_24870 [Burkholderia multivorans]|nr:hypothetical protein [Burkholderia multivorans]